MPKRKPTKTSTAAAAADSTALLVAAASDPPGKKTKQGTGKLLSGNPQPLVSTRVTRSRSKQNAAVAVEKTGPAATTVSGTTAQAKSYTSLSPECRLTALSSSLCSDEAGRSCDASQADWGERRAGCDGDSESSRDDWEEVEDAAIESDDEEELNRHKPSLPAEGISVELEHPHTKKRKQERADLERKRKNRNKRLVQEALHKTHFLCLFARGFYLNRITFHRTVQGICLSHMSFLCHQAVHKSPQADRQFITDFMRGFAGYFDLQPDPSFQGNSDDHQRLISCLTSRTAKTSVEYVMAFISLLRAIRTFQNLDYSVRLILPIRPIPLKVTGLIRSDKEQQRTKSAKRSRAVTATSKKNRVMLSSDDDDDVIVEPKKVSKKRSSAASSALQCPPIWAEVYLTSEEQWMSVEILNGLLDEPQQIEKTFEEAFNYVIAYDDEHVVKEVSCRYAQKALTAPFNRLRIDKEWLDETLSCFKPLIKSVRETDENKHMNAILASRPMPKTLSEFKNHPLYVLKRHLLVYDAIYPPDTGPVDHFREEPVYSRSCVKPVRSKEYWKRKARVLKEDAHPYKVVKGRKKWDKYAEKYITDIPKELYGFWQTEPYQPPVASGGKVPRNEFGNVELFQPCMLPIGTVHLRLPALARVAHKLGIDCVPAVVGFDNAKAGVVPVIDGYVVCEEFRETLLAAFEEEQHNARQRQEAKRLKNVYANWRRLTRALLIRERLSLKYSE